MQDISSEFETPLEGLRREDWLNAVEQMVAPQGYVDRLGERHAAIFVQDKPTLIVTFETHDSIELLSESNQPLGWDLALATGWSHLALVSDGDTWFRDPKVYGFFDRLIDDGFFDQYERVVFFGAKSCGYAAAAFSVAAPGAWVISISPQATLDPSIAEWDDRFLRMRRTSFSNRFGYAPDMLDAAEQAFVFYDPEVELDAMHSALFLRPNVNRIRLRYLGGEITQNLLGMQILYRMLAQAGAGKLTRKSFAELWRARREHGRYLNHLLTSVLDHGSPTRIAYLCNFVLSRGNARRFRRALKTAQDNAKESGIKFPQLTI